MPKLSLVLFFILFAFLTAILAMLLSRFFISQDSGLAGGASVLAYGLFGFIGGIIAAWLLKERMSAEQIGLFNKIGGGISIVLIIWLVIRFRQNQAQAPEIPDRPKTEVPGQN
ncbi:MAG: hypothetical protein AAF696_06040 [Bacteroidota bacterium]